MARPFKGEEKRTTRQVSIEPRKEAFILSHGYDKLVYWFDEMVETYLTEKGYKDDKKFD